MSYHCDRCGKPIEREDADDALIPRRVDAGCKGDDGTPCGVDDHEDGRYFSFTISAPDPEIAEHYHRVCALDLLKDAVVKTLEHLAIDGEVPP